MAGAAYVINKVYHIQVPKPYVDEYGDVGVTIEAHDTNGYDTNLATLGICIALGAWPEIIAEPIEDTAPTYDLNASTVHYFLIQYGLNAASNGVSSWETGHWVNSVPNDWRASCGLTYSQQDSNRWTFQVSAGGNALIYDTTNTASNSRLGDTTNYLSKIPIILERTTNFINWEPLLTNSIATNTVNQFTDLNPLPERAFYRIRCITNSP